MLDNKFTKAIEEWLKADRADSEAVKEGAMLLLRVNRDTAMYQRIINNPKREVKFLKYKLTRVLKMRQDGLTPKDVVRMERELVPKIVRAEQSDKEAGEDDKLPVEEEKEDGSAMVRKGLRPDHDKLPEKIKAIWPRNAERWKKIKKLRETCKNLTAPCDRYEYLPALKEAWYKYKEEMATYDEYRLTEDEQGQKSE